MLALPKNNILIVYITEVKFYPTRVERVSESVLVVKG